jgi:hypothetical protein
LFARRVARSNCSKIRSRSPGASPISLIGNADDRVAAVHCDLDPQRFLITVFDCIGQEIGNRLIELEPVPRSDRPGIGGGGYLQVGKLFAKPGDHFGDQLVEIERFEVQFEPARSDSRDVEQSFDQHMQAVQVKSRFVEEFANACNLAGPAM